MVLYLNDDVFILQVTGAINCGRETIIRYPRNQSHMKKIFNILIILVLIGCVQIVGALSLTVSFMMSTHSSYCGNSYGSDCTYISGYAPLTVNFESTSYGTVPFNHHWDWDFGDGTKDSGSQHLTHTYNSPGTYYPSLTEGCSDGQGGYVWSQSPRGVVKVYPPTPVVTATRTTIPTTVRTTIRTPVPTRLSTTISTTEPTTIRTPVPTRLPTTISTIEPTTEPTMTINYGTTIAEMQKQIADPNAKNKEMGNWIDIWQKKESCGVKEALGMNYVEHIYLWGNDGFLTKRYDVNYIGLPDVKIDISKFEFDTYKQTYCSASSIQPIAPSTIAPVAVANAVSPWIQMTSGAGWVARESPSGVAMPDGSIVLMGGQDSSGKLKNDVWQSTDNGATWKQMTPSAGWSPRWTHSSVVMPDGSIVLMGGRELTGDRNDVWRSTDNGATWTLMTASAGWSARMQHSSVAMPDGSIVLMGGGDSTNGWKNDVWRSTDNGATWTLMTASAIWSARSGHSSVAIPDGSIVLMGGYSGHGFNDVWRSTDNGNTWTRLTKNAEWSPRWTHSSVMMRDGSIVLMGGYSDSKNWKNDVWRFTPSGWK